MPSIISATTTAGVSVTGDNSGALQLATNNGTTAVTIDTSQNVGIGTSSPSTYANSFAPVGVIGTGNNWATIQGRTDGPSGAANGVSYGVSYQTNPINGARIWLGSQGSAGQQGMIGFFTKNTDDNTNQPTERMRIDSSGNLLVGTTTAQGGTSTFAVDGNVKPVLAINNTNSISQSDQSIRFVRNGSTVGTIATTLSATAYNTNSDYRLKENIVPMTGALQKVAQLKPVTYKWKADGSDGQGFIAHELAEVVPDCVSGEKDAVDEEGNPKYQGVDTSFLVATLTAALQELNAKVEAQAVRIAELEGAK